MTSLIYIGEWNGEVEAGAMPIGFGDTYEDALTMALQVAYANNIIIESHTVVQTKMDLSQAELAQLDKALN